MKIRHGRTYADVPPIRGVYRGVAMARHDAAVTMTRLDPQAGARAQRGFGQPPGRSRATPVIAGRAFALDFAS